MTLSRSKKNTVMKETEIIYDVRKMSDDDMMKELIKEEDVVITIFK